jgi:hypothetical protein
MADVGDHRFLRFDGQGTGFQHRSQAFIHRGLDHDIGTIVDGDVAIRLDCLPLLWRYSLHESLQSKIVSHRPRREKPNREDANAARPSWLGIPGYACTIGAHYIVGYENRWHLPPAFAGLVVFTVAQVFCYPFLATPDPALLDEWRERR